jgi:hypothetical protein
MSKQYSKAVEVLRWLAVIPGGLLVGFLALFPLHWVLYFTLVKGSMVQMPMADMAPIERFLSPIVSSICFVLAGAIIAPRKKRLVACVLFFMIVFIRISVAMIADTMTAWTVLGTLGVLLVSCALLVICHIGTYALLGLWWRLRITEIQLFYGPSLKIQLPFARLQIGCIPLGGCVQFAKRNEGDIQTDSTLGDRLNFQQDLPRWRQTLLTVSGPITVLIVAMVLLGPSEAALSFGRGFGQLVEGCLSPRAKATEWLRSYFGLWQTHQFTLATGILAAKMAMLNLLPLPPMAGGQAVMSLFAPRVFPLSLLYWSLLVVYVIMGIWSYAMIVALVT